MNSESDDTTSFFEEQSSLSTSSLPLDKKVEKLKMQLKFQKNQYDSDRDVLLEMIEKTTEEKGQVSPIPIQHFHLPLLYLGY